MNTVEYLIKNLENIGINDFFGVPGDYNFNILDAIQNNAGTNWIGCTNELNAGYAADGYARQKGFGAIVTTFGVGELSAMNAIAGSYAENIPVIHIVGTPTTKTLSSKLAVHHTFAEPDQYCYLNAAKTVTKTTAFLNKDNAKIEIDRVLKTFIKERKPVYIAIPSDIATLEISNKKVDYDWISDSKTLTSVVEKIVDKIKKSEKPVIIADTLIKRFNAKIEFREFIEASGIPVTNFLMGNDIINHDYNKYLGTYYSNKGNPVAKKYIDNTDCLISIGVIYGDTNSAGNDIPFDINSHIAIYGTYTYINGKRYDNVRMSDVLDRLSRHVTDKKITVEQPSIGYGKSTTTTDKMSVSYLFSRLQEYIKENDIIIADTGLISFGITQMKLPQNTTLHTQLQWCSIGWATPAAFGASIANPNSRIILITGDGAHQMTAVELGNMFKHNQKPIIIVLNNNGYTIERVLCNNPEKEFNNIVQIDYTKFARSFKGDLWSSKIETAEDFDKALRITQIMNKLCYLEICTEEMDIPEYLKKLFSDKSTKQVDNIEEVKQNTEQPSNKEKLTLSQSDKKNYETHVHTSLKELE